jgi:hypothetical protein
MELDLPVDQLTALETLRNQFAAFHKKCQSASASKMYLQTKNDKKKALIETKEIFVRNHLQNNDKMTDAIRVELGLPVRDTTPASRSKPKIIPYTEAGMPLPRTVLIPFPGVNIKNHPPCGLQSSAHGAGVPYALT